MVDIRLNADLQKRIIFHLEAGYPNEAGGFLLGELTRGADSDSDGDGDGDGDTVTILDIIPIDNVFAAEEQYHRYAMTPQDWARLEDEADARGLGLVGYFHSHPDSPAIPSVFDRDHALPNFVYIITQVDNGGDGRGKAVDMRVWRLQPDRTGFDAHRLILESSEGSAITS